MVYSDEYLRRAVTQQNQPDPEGGPLCLAAEGRAHVTVVGLF